MALPSLGEIKERKVAQWGLAYLGGAWLLLQVTALLSAAYGWPSLMMRALPVVLAVGFLAALVLAWYHGEKGAQRVSGPELAILGGLLLLGGLGVMLLGGGDAVEADPAGAAIVGLPAPEVDETAIAVLPFESIGGDGVFAAGLTDELHQTLSLVPSLRVTAQTSAGVFRQVSVSADSIGRALNVAHLVEGTVRTVGDRVRIAVRLVHAATGQQEWSESYDRDVADVFAVQEQIARAVASELRVEIGSAAAVDRASTDPEVFALVVRARRVVERGVLSDDLRGALEEATSLLEEATSRDSSYAAAWAELASVRFLSSELGRDREAFVGPARRALALDPGAGLAHRVLGSDIVVNGGSLETARDHLERAVTGRPADAQSLGRLAYVLMLLGEQVAALRTAERAAALDPLDPEPFRLAAFIYSGAERHDRAIEFGRMSVRLAPDQPVMIIYLALVLAAAGETEEAILLAQRTAESDSGFGEYGSFRAFVHAKAGHRSEAERLLDGLPDDFTTAHMMRASVEAALGDSDAAFEALERSLGEGEPSTLEIPTNPLFLTLRDDSRWDPLVRRIRATARES